MDFTIDFLLQGARMNDQRADFPGLIPSTSMANPTSVASTGSHMVPTTVPSVVNTTAIPQRNTSTSMTTNGGGGGVGRMRSASDGLAEQVPSAADELAPGDDFFDMIFRLQVQSFLQII